MVWTGAAQGEAGPPNDHRANAASGPGAVRIDLTVPLVGSTLGATKEPGEPDHAGQPGGASVWYWIVGRGQPVTFETVGSSFDTVLAVYRSQPFGSIAETVASDNDSAGGGASRVNFLAADGVPYLIAVDGVGGASGAFRLTGYLTPPANDDFAGAAPLTGPAGQASAVNVAATTEPGEPLHDADPSAPSYSSVWWSWTAPVSGPVTFDASQSQTVCCGWGSNFFPRLAIYSGTSLGSLVPVAFTRPSADAKTFTASAGTTYSIAVAAAPPSNPGRVVLKWGLPPANDDLANAQAIAGAGGSVTGTNTAATNEPGEPEHWQDPAATGASIWYQWTAPAAGSATMTTAGSDTGIILAVYTGEGYASPGLTLVGRGFAITFATQAGTTYRIALDARNPFRGDTKLNWNLAGPPNDHRANAIPGPGASVEIDGAQPLVGSTLGATKEPGEPAHAGEPGGASVWYLFAGRGVSVTFETVGSSFDTVLAVYRCNAFCETIEPVASDNDSAGGRASRVSFVAGDRVGYLIAVDGVGGASGALRLTGYLTPPANDAFADAEQLVGPAGRVSGLNVGATVEPGEPLHETTPQFPSSRSIWWRWTAPTGGPVTFDVSRSEDVCCGFGSSFGPAFAIYTGTSVGSLTPVSSTLAGRSRTFVATAGTTYSIAAATAVGFGNASSGRAVLNWGVPPANDDFANAQVIAGVSGSVTGNNTAATSEPGEPEHWQDPAASRASIWYAWTAPASSSATLTTTGSDTGTILAVYAGAGYSSPGLTLVGRGTSVTFAAQAGTTYRVALDARNPFRGNTQLNWNLAGPPNDHRANAVSGPGAVRIDLTVPLVGSTLGATKEPGEPAHAGEPGGASVWYYILGRGLPVTFETVGSSFDTVLAVYRSQPFGSIAEAVASDNDSAGGGASRVSFLAADGVPYLIAVDGVGGASGALRLTGYLTPPANDDFAESAQIAGPAGRASALNVAATTEPGEPLHDADATFPSYSSVWWSWTAAVSGPVTFDASLSEDVPGFGHTSPRLAIYTGTSLASLAPVAFTRPSADAKTFIASAGTTYSIAVAAAPPSGPGRVVLQWGLPPANDDLANAQMIAGAQGSATGNNTAATRELGEPEHWQQPAGSRASIWYSWTALGSGSTTLTTAGSETATVLAVYTGQGYASPGLTLVARGFSVTFAAQAGITYRVALDGVNPFRGDTRLSWNFLTMNSAPVAQEGSATVAEGAAQELTLGASDPDGDPLTYSIVGHPAHGTLSAVVGNTVTYTPDPGYHGADSFTFRASDGELDSNTATISLSVSPVNDAPLVVAGDDTAIEEGGSLSRTGSFTDPDSAGWTATVDYDDATGSYPLTLEADGTFQLSRSYADEGTHTVTVRVTDEDGASGTATFDVGVTNVAPTIERITAPTVPMNVGTTVPVTGVFADPGTVDTHTALWNWGDGTSSAGAVSGRSISGNHRYAAAGAYSITLTVTDDDGGSGESVFQYVVVYNPKCSFVIGGGWINSPVGAYAADPALVGKASFGFVSLYTKAGTTPFGGTAFHFKSGGVRFFSASYESLVITGARAAYRGSGTVNGEGSYSFILTAIDGQLPGGGGRDKFRIKIVDKQSGTVIYDNGRGAADDSPPSTTLGGGWIFIKK